MLNFNFGCNFPLNDCLPENMTMITISFNEIKQARKYVWLSVDKQQNDVKAKVLYGDQSRSQCV